MPMRKLLITGEDGFVGRNILAMEQEIRLTFGWELVRAPAAYELRDQASLDALVSATRPDGVIHLAGISFVPDSFKDPEATLQINLLGTLHLLQALKKISFAGSFLYVSSGDVYGRLNVLDLPVHEKHLPQPSNPYAVSKLATEALCCQWAQTEDFKLLVARPFNHIGPGQREDFVLGTMARQIVRIKRGQQSPFIKVGDIDVMRDFLDVRDVISAYLHLLDKGQSGEIYNVCSGEDQRIRDLILTLQRLAGVEAELQHDAERFRPTDQREVIGCNRKLIAATTWKPCHVLDDTLKTVLDDWERRES
jgi:GDP-4-dehydro-6-deoxy-D-mannose reductase